jgi:hypothetical protein
MTKKTTSALAIAALVASGAASATTIQIDDSTSVSVGFNAFATYASVDKDAREAKTDFLTTVAASFSQVSTPRMD